MRHKGKGASFLSRILETVFIIAVALWVGAMMLLAVVVAPGVFTVMPSRQEAGNLMSHLFVGYYHMGALCGLAALIAGGLQAYLGRHRWGTIRFWITGLMVVSTLYAGFVVTPHAQVIRMQLSAPGSESNRASLQREFQRAHGQAVTANAIALLSGLVVLGMVGLAERRSGQERPATRLG
ncbi:MAG TPA: DUF4149 domain-containing protein [Nitrospiria bacterium]|nr:DUF4149 domain-containing protein [Nitrospiria bacterium]